MPKGSKYRIHKSAWKTQRQTKRWNLGPILLEPRLKEAEDLNCLNLG